MFAASGFPSGSALLRLNPVRLALRLYTLVAPLSAAVGHHSHRALRVRLAAARAPTSPGPIESALAVAVRGAVLDVRVDTPQRTTAVELHTSVVVRLGPLRQITSPLHSLARM